MFIDHPFANGDGLSLQADVVGYDGGRTFAELPRQDTWLAEAGYFSKATRLSPFVQLASQRFSADSIPDQSQVIGGLAWFIVSHKLNVKVAAGRARQAGRSASAIYQLTFQSFEF